MTDELFQTYAWRRFQVLFGNLPIGLHFAFLFCFIPPLLFSTVGHRRRLGRSLGYGRRLMLITMIVVLPSVVSSIFSGSVCGSKILIVRSLSSYFFKHVQFSLCLLLLMLTSNLLFYPCLSRLPSPSPSSSTVTFLLHIYPPVCFLG